jgi:hypothetical protein
VAEPWSNDFAALAERTQQQLRAPAATRASLSTRTQETPKMSRFMKSHPALTAVIALAVLGAASGAAYAVVREVWVNVDSSESAPEIEQDVTTQLQQQGVTATVQADKSDDGLRVAIKTLGHEGSDPNPDLHIHVNGEPATGKRLQLQIDGELEDTDGAALAEAASCSEMIAVLKADYPNTDALAAAITKVLADHGFPNATVRVGGDGNVSVSVTAASPARP